MEKKEKAKSVQKYAILICVAAILLVLISSVSRFGLDPSSEVKKEENEQQNSLNNLEQSVVTLVNERDEIVEKNTALSYEIEELKKEKAKVEEQLTNQAKRTDALTNLIAVQELIDKKDYDKAFETINIIDESTLNETEMNLYNDFVTTLTKKGYEF